MKQTEKTAKNETEPMEQAILRAAERLFLDKGFALTSTTEIAREAGCNQALVHYYFRTKENLFSKRFSFITISARKRTFSRKFSNRKYGC